MTRLMGATALAAALATGPAAAQSWSVEVGGFFTGAVGFVDIGDNAAGLNADGGDENDTNDFALSREAELEFIGEITADNGITFGVETELNLDDSADTGGLSVDENYLYVETRWGEFQIGEADGAADEFNDDIIVEPSFATVQDGDGFLFDYLDDEAGFDLDNDGGDTSDDLKITYFSPKIFGFQAGASYAPGGNDKGQVASRAEDDGALEFGAAFDTDIGDVAIDTSVGYTHFFDRDRDTVGGRIRLAYGGLEVGAGVGWEENVANSGDGDDTTSVGGGAVYAVGPWRAGVDGIIEVDNDGDTNPFGIAASVGYALAPGVEVGAAVEYFDPDDEFDESVAASSFIDVSF